jgi:lipopolysaccharide biosynthesis glycosyltransferase
MKIVLCTDNNYVDEALTCISYLNKTQKNINIDIIGYKLTSKNKFKLEANGAIVLEFNCDNELGSRFRPNFMKLYIPKYCTDDKVLYLDTDTITVRRLNLLWQTDISNYYAACVRNIATPRAITSKHYLEFNIEENTLLANLGVMLINCKKWRDDSVTSKLIKFTNQVLDELEIKYSQTLALARIQKEEFSFNSLLKDQWIELDEKWNVTPLSKITKPYIIHTWHDPSSIYK